MAPLASEGTMGKICEVSQNALPKLLAMILSLTAALPATAYDYPLTSTAIREAYFLGRRQGGLGTEFLADYRHAIPSLRVEEFISFARIETPFVQVAVQSSRKLNYSAQDAVQEFLGKPLSFRIHLEICYMPDAPSDAVKIRLIQNQKEIVPASVDRSAFYPPTDPYTRVASIGETMNLDVDALKLDGSTLTIYIETPDGRDTPIEFDLQSLR
jgi:hypothetical protein